MSEDRGVSFAADFSPDRTYRYTLRRAIPAPLGSRPNNLVVIGLNPSKADEHIDDPTIRRDIGFARRLGFNMLTKLNLFAYRATDPSELSTPEDPIGPDNDLHLIRECDTGDLIIVAWGAHGSLRGRSTEVGKLIGHLAHKIRHLGTLTKAGEPRHTLYLKADAPLKAMTWP